MMTVKGFDLLNGRDFENSAVFDEIRATIRWAENAFVVLEGVRDAVDLDLRTEKGSMLDDRIRLLLKEASIG